MLGNFTQNNTEQRRHVKFAKNKSPHIWRADIKNGGKHLTGRYTANNGKSYRYDSSYELRRMKELDYLDKDVISWTRCDFSIPWTDTNGKEHAYHPDFLVVRADGTTTIEETKGLFGDDDLRKMIAGKEFAKSRGWNYKLIQYEKSITFLPKMNRYENSFGSFVRPSEETIFMQMALTLSLRSTCLRKQVCAVFTDAEMQRVLCFGYNGNVAAGPNECDSLQEGNCGCTHAEINALTKSVASLQDAICFVTLSPCLACAKVLINRGIKRVVYYETYRNVAGLNLLRQFDVCVEKFDSLEEVTSAI